MHYPRAIYDSEILSATSFQIWKLRRSNISMYFRSDVMKSVSRSDSRPDSRSDSRWIEIKDRNLVMLILQAYADSDKKKILTAAEKPRIIMDIIDICKLPQTSTYRKIGSLMQNGLLIPCGHHPIKFGKVVTRYASLFENLEINIIRNEVSIRAKIGEDSRQAVLRMMRDNIVSMNRDEEPRSKGSVTMSDGKQSQSIIPFLIKERMIKAKGK